VIRIQGLMLNNLIRENERLGFAFSLVNDAIGPIDEIYFVVDFRIQYGCCL